MKPKTLMQLAGGLLGLGALTLAADQKRRALREIERTARIRAIRQELGALGDIAVLYVIPSIEANDLTGGVVLEDSRRYTFRDHKQTLTYEEDPA